MTGDLDRPVVAGFDGSPSSAAALDAAAVEAVNLGAPLCIVHAYVWPILYATLANVPYNSCEWQPPPTQRAALAATASVLASRHNGLRVQTQVVAGSGGTVLVGASKQASLLVIGGRGIGGVEGMLAGSVAPYVVCRADCPVMVVRAGQGLSDSAGSVVVGVDGSLSSRQALRYGCEWAQRRGADVEALYAAPPREPGADPQWLGEWVRAAERDFPQLRVKSSVVVGEASRVLMTASRSARLVVVGTRNRGEIASLVLGSVGQDLIRRSGCPVLVVRGSALTGEAPASGPTG